MKINMKKKLTNNNNNCCAWNGEVGHKVPILSAIKHMKPHTTHTRWAIIQNFRWFHDAYSTQENLNTLFIFDTF